MKRLNRIILLLFLTLILVACGNEITETPTTTTETAAATNTLPAPTATTAPIVSPSDEPTATNNPTVTPSPIATIEPEATATTEPEPTHTPEPVIVPLTVIQPVRGSEVTAETDLTVSGQVDPAAAASVNLSLQAGTATLVTGTASVDTNTGAWLTTLAVPPSVTGIARLVASTGSENVLVDITLLPGTDSEGAILRLERPAAGATLVAGYAAFFEGTALDVISDTLTIAILADNCGTVAAAQSFTISGGEWRGFIILPPDLSGPACAVVATGAPNTPDWRQTQIPIVLLAAAETGAGRIELGNPTFAEYTAGTTTTLFGVAVNAPESGMQLSATLGGIAILPLTTVGVDNFGYWELDLALPAGQTGNLTVTASMEVGGETITAEWVLLIE